MMAKKFSIMLSNQSKVVSNQVSRRLYQQDIANIYQTNTRVELSSQKSVHSKERQQRIIQANRFKQPSSESKHTIDYEYMQNMSQNKLDAS